MHLRNVLVTVFASVAFAVLLAVAPQPAYATEFISRQMVTVPADASVSGSLFATGSTVDMEGTVHGDLFCAGKTVTVSGTVDGDVICAGQTLTVSGTVHGNVRAAGQMLSVSATVDRNVTVAGQTVALDGASVAGEVFAAGNDGNLEARIGRDTHLAFGSLILGGNMGGNVGVRADSLRVARDASIAGSLSYESANTADIAASATVSGGISHTYPARTGQSGQKQAAAPAFGMRSFGFLVRLVFWTVIGLLGVTLLPGFFGKTDRIIRKRTARTAGMGSLLFLGVPAALIILLVTIIGIPLAVFLGFVWVVWLIVIRLVAAVTLGKWLWETVLPKSKHTPAADALVGIPVTWILFAAPFVGWLISLAAMIVGTGAAFLTREPEKRTT